MTDPSTLEDNLTTLGALTAALSKASGKLLGKSANSIMHLSGMDMGREDGRKLDRTRDVALAIDMAMKARLRGWEIELWKDADQAEFVVQEPGREWAWLVFRACPVRQVCLAYDLEMGETLCHLGHGYLAGVLSEILGKKADLALEHAGINACKKRLTIKGG